MKILFLLADVFSYNLSVINTLSKKYSYDVHLIHWGTNVGSLNHLKFYDHKFNIYKKPDDLESLLALVERIDSKNIVLSGWMDLSYLLIALKYRAKGCQVICAMDTQFQNTLKQKIGAFIFHFNIFRRLFFTNVWLPGFPQFEAAIRFGFNYDEIIFGLLSGDTNVFFNRTEDRIQTKKFLFVGRLEKVKGIEDLINVWERISKIHPDWKLVVAGEGSLRDKILQLDNVIYKGFLNPNEVSLLMNDTDCFILPSNYEPWGLVIHEAALCGLPIICSDKCGAHSFFLIDEFNGFLIQDRIEKNLYNSMIKFINLEKDDFKVFSERSLILGRQISTDIAAAHFNSKLLK